MSTRRLHRVPFYTSLNGHEMEMLLSLAHFWGLPSGEALRQALTLVTVPQLEQVLHNWPGYDAPRRNVVKAYLAPDEILRLVPILQHLERSVAMILRLAVYAAYERIPGHDGQ